MFPTTEDLFNLKETQFSDIFDDINQVWEVVPRISRYCTDHVSAGNNGVTIHKSVVIEGDVQIGKGTVIGPNVVIVGPAIIGENCEFRPGAFIRGNVLIGNNCVIGNSTEIKNVLIFNGAHIPHFSYIGDSLVGWKAHFGGGAATSNQKSDGSEIIVKHGDDSYSTGMTKLGAIIGDEVELGSNALLNPGTIIGKQTTIYPGSVIRGVIPANSIVKVRQQQEIIEKY